MFDLQAIKRFWDSPWRTGKRRKTGSDVPAVKDAHADPASSLAMQPDTQQYEPQPAGTSAAHMNGNASTQGAMNMPAQTSHRPINFNHQPIPDTSTTRVVPFHQLLQNPIFGLHSREAAGHSQQPQAPYPTAPLANTSMHLQPAHAPAPRQQPPPSRPALVGQSQPTQAYPLPTQHKATAWNFRSSQSDRHGNMPPAQQEIEPPTHQAAQLPISQAEWPSLAPAPAVPHSEVKPRHLNYSRHSTPGPAGTPTPMLGNGLAGTPSGAWGQRQRQQQPPQQLPGTQRHQPHRTTFARELERVGIMGGRRTNYNPQAQRNFGGRKTANNVELYREHLAEEIRAEERRQQQAASHRSSAYGPRQLSTPHLLPQPRSTIHLEQTELAPAAEPNRGWPGRFSQELEARAPSATIRPQAASALVPFASPRSTAYGVIDLDSIQADEAMAKQADQKQAELQARMNKQLSQLMKEQRPSGSQSGQAAGSSGAQGQGAPLTVAAKLAQLTQTKEQSAREVADVRAMNELRIRDIQAPKPIPQPPQPLQPPAEAKVVEEVVLSDDEEEEEVVVLDDEEEEYEEGEEEEEEEEGEEEGDYEDGVGDEAPVPSNTPDELSTWKDLMSRPGPSNTLVVEHGRSSLPLTLHSLRTLKDGTWLNDEIINVSMALMQERDWNLSQRPGGRPAGSPKVHYFSSFFLNKLHKDTGVYSFKEVSRWTKTAKIKKYGQACSNVLECDMLIFPVHVGQSHWATACVHLKERRLKYWDSMATGCTPVLEHLAQWVVHEAEDKLGRGTPAALSWADALSWPRDMPKSVPQQHNGCDCGVFAIMFAAFGGAGKSFDFRQKDMPVVRRRLMHDLSNLKWTIS